MDKVYVLYFYQRLGFNEKGSTVEKVYQNYEDGASDFRDMVEEVKDSLPEYFPSGTEELTKKKYEKCTYTFNLFSDTETKNDLHFTLAIGTLFGKKISVNGYYEAREFIAASTADDDEDIELDFEQAVEDAIHAVAVSHMKDIIQFLHMKGWQADDAGEIFNRMKEREVTLDAFTIHKEPELQEELTVEAPEVVAEIQKEESEPLNGFTAQNKANEAIEEIVSEQAKEIDEVLNPTEEEIEMPEEITAAVKAAIKEVESQEFIDAKKELDKLMETEEEEEVIEAPDEEQQVEEAQVEAPVQEVIEEVPVETKKEIERPKVSFSKLSF